MSRVVERFAGLLVIGLLCTGMYAAFREGAAALLTQGVGGRVQQWAKNPRAADLGDWERVRAYADRAVEWMPCDPEALRIAAAVSWWGAWHGDSDTKRSGPLVERTLELYRESIRQRPTWPDGWLHLARAKHWSGQWDDEFQHAYAMAWRTGSWREPVLFAAAELGFSARRQLTPENRERFHTALERASLRDARRIRKMARAQGDTFILCLALRDHQPTREYCSDRGYRLDGCGTASCQSGRPRK